MSRTVYSLIFYLCLPIFALRLWWRGIKAPHYRDRMRERFGFVAPADDNPIWIHAVSVGEVIAISGVLERLLVEHPMRSFLVTTTTPTGADQVQRLFGQRVHHRYMPWDAPDAVKRFLDRIDPSCCLIVETEIWPNLLTQVSQREIPVLLANARLSERSYRRYQRFPGFSKQILRCLTAICAQYEEDALRFRMLGVEESKLSVTGTIKADLTLDPTLVKQGQVWREEIGERPIVVAASTHDADDQVILAAWSEVLNSLSDALLILVPRHPERFDSVALAIQEHNFTFARRSSDTKPTSAHQLWLGDSLGELVAYLAASDIAFIGGSFSGTGGHNPLEPAALCLPILMGPSQFNFHVICRQLEEKGGLRTVSDDQDLKTQIVRLIESVEDRKRSGQAAFEYLEQQRGASDRLLEVIDRTLLKTSSEQP